MCGVVLDRRTMLESVPEVAGCWAIKLVIPKSMSIECLLLALLTDRPEAILHHPHVPFVSLALYLEWKALIINTPLSYPPPQFWRARPCATDCNSSTLRSTVSWRSQIYPLEQLSLWTCSTDPGPDSMCIKESELMSNVLISIKARRM